LDSSGTDRENAINLCVDSDPFEITGSPCCIVNGTTFAEMPVQWNRISYKRIVVMYFIMVCWIAVILLMSIAFMRRLW